MDDRKIVKRAIKAAGGPAELARRISELVGKPISMQAVSQWYRIPVERVKPVESITGIPRHELRPDIYDAPARAKPQEARP